MAASDHEWTIKRLNVMTYNEAKPVPRAQDCLDAMAGSRMFSTMDILSAYNQVPMAEKDIPKMLFTTKYGVMASPATYQWLMELALSSL